MASFHAGFEAAVKRVYTSFIVKNVSHTYDTLLIVSMSQLRGPIIDHRHVYDIECPFSRHFMTQ